LPSPHSDRIAVVSIARRFDDPYAMPLDRLYPAIGQNTGNYMFTEAMFRLIAGQAESVGFRFDPAEVNALFDHMVIPAANWLNPKSDWSDLAARVAALNIPVTLIGLGLQAASDKLDEVVVTPSALDMVRMIAAKSPAVSVRGAFTARWLASQGITNTVVTGCPSLYMEHLAGPSPRQSGEVVLQSTRYALNPAFVAGNSVHRKMFALAGALDLPMVYQSERDEMHYLMTGRWPQAANPDLAALYGLPNVRSVESWLSRKGQVFFDLATWSRFLKGHRGVVGTRLHGVILSLISGVPAVLVPHDSRTREMAAFAGIPQVAPEVVRPSMSGADLAALVDEADLAPWRERRRENAGVMAKFLSEAGLSPAPLALFGASSDPVGVAA
jgi:Polysaccharide pyruvyl transferase